MFSVLQSRSMKSITCTRCSVLILQTDSTIVSEIKAKYKKNMMTSIEFHDIYSSLSIEI